MLGLECWVEAALKFFIQAIVHQLFLNGIIAHTLHLFGYVHHQHMLCLIETVSQAQ